MVKTPATAARVCKRDEDVVIKLNLTFHIPLCDNDMAGWLASLVVKHTVKLYLQFVNCTEHYWL